MTVKKFIQPDSINLAIEWNSLTLPTATAWADVVWNGTIFCAISHNSTVAATSPDGITWTQRVLPISFWWGKISWNGSVFCIVGTNSSSNIIATSPDGITWIQRALPVLASWSCMAVKGSVFCIAASGSSIAVTSPDGITWTQRALPVSASWYTMAASNLVFCIIAANSTIAATSPDGVAWTQRTMPVSAAWFGLAWNGTIFCAISGSSTVSATSPDGAIWAQGLFPKVPSGGFYWNGLEWNGNVFCSVCYGSNISVTSPDTVTWTQQVLPISSGWGSLASDGNKFCAVSLTSGVAATSIPASGKTYSARIEDALTVLNASPLGDFAPYASSPPDMKINMAAGLLKNELGISLGGTGTVVGAAQETLLISIVGYATSAFVAPMTANRIDRICLNFITNTYQILSGVEGGVAPSYPDWAIPICQVSLSVGQSSITNAHITDERGMISNDSPALSSGGVITAFGNVSRYEVFNASGVYSLVKPEGFKFMRLSAVGAGGGAGGSFLDALQNYYVGGSGGGGAIIEGFVVSAQNLNIVIGLGGLSGQDSTPAGTNNATSGVAGGDTILTFVSGLVLTLKGGGFGVRSIGASLYGAGGLGGAAISGGFAGEAGKTSTTINNITMLGGRTGSSFTFGTGAAYGTSGNVPTNGSGSQPYGAKGSDGVVLVEWFN